MEKDLNKLEDMVKELPEENKMAQKEEHPLCITHHPENPHQIYY
jgi:hypothetical protein